MLKRYAKVIVNPVAGACSTGRRWPRISKLLRHCGLVFDYEYTEGVGHATQLAQEATEEGYPYLVAVGGDGTINEVANGILGANGPSKTALGVISTGTGSDFIRSVGIPRDLGLACSSLAGSKRFEIDVGVVEYQSGGRACRRFFVNAAGVGFDATVVETTLRLPKYFRGTVPYLFGLFRSFLGYRNKRVSLAVGDEVEEARILSVVVANGSYFGGGMKMAPLAKTDDSLLDVVIVDDIGKFELLQALPTVYKGTHINHPKVRMTRATRVTVESEERLLVHADGELLGEAPATFWLKPAALSLVVQ